MEDVLTVYKRSYNPNKPVVCMDEISKQLSKETREIAAWQEERNTARAKVDWRITTADARIKLKRLYPTLSC